MQTFHSRGGLNVTAISNLKIGARLALGFALVLLLTTVLGLASLNAVSKVNASTEDMAKNWLPAIRALGDYRTAVNLLRRVGGQYVTSSTDDEFARWDQRMADGKTAAAKAWKQYVATVDTPEEKALAGAIEADQERFYQAQDEVIARAKSERHFSDELRQLSLGDSLTRFNALSDDIEKDVALQAKSADGAYAASQATFHGTRYVVIGLLVGAFVFGIGIAYWVTISITAPIREAVAVAETVASGDLSSRIVVKSRDETGQLLDALRRMNESLVGIVGDVRQASDSIATGTTQIASGNADLSQRTEEQASNLQQTAASMEQMTATVQKNAEAAQQARQLSSTASEAAAKGGEVVGKVVATMAQISESSKKIGDIIGTIDGIAFQTNILALNAAVEAARAGEQGRGFAVVAGEVRTLAQRSAEAAREIKSLIGNSVEKVETGSALVGDAGVAIDDIMLQVQRVNDLVGEISASSLEQNQGIGQIGDAVNQLDQVTQQNAALVEESAAAAESLKHQAEQLAQTVARFRLSGDESGRAAAAPVKRSVAPAPRATAAAKPATPAKALATARKAPAARPVVRAGAKPAARAAAPAPVAAAVAAAADDDHWETF